MIPDPNVRPNISRLTDEDARRLLSDGIVRACALPGPYGGTMGPSRVGLEIGCDEKTVRRARDAESTLGLACAFNLLDVDHSALDALLAAKGFVAIPLAHAGAPDAIVSSGAVICRLGLVRAQAQGVETDEDLAGMETEIEAAEAALVALHSRIASYRLRRNS